MAKLQLEISQVDETVTPLTRADLLRFTYLQNIIKEGKLGCQGSLHVQFI